MESGGRDPDVSRPLCARPLDMGKRGVSAFRHAHFHRALGCRSCLLVPSSINYAGFFLGFRRHNHIFFSFFQWTLDQADGDLGPTNLFFFHHVFFSFFGVENPTLTHKNCPATVTVWFENSKTNLNIRFSLDFAFFSWRFLVTIEIVVT